MTRRKPLPKGAVAEIDTALWQNSEAARAVLAIAKAPGSDGRLVEVINRIYESTLALKRAKAVDPVSLDDVHCVVLEVLNRANIDLSRHALQDLSESLRRCIEGK